MLSVKIELHRVHDRKPSNHMYGEPFDSCVDSLVGGVDKWSFPREPYTGAKPRALILGTDIAVELHEGGPTFDFVFQNLDQIPNYVSAIASVVSAWIAARALRKQELPKDDYLAKSGTIIEFADLRILSQRDLKPEEIQRLVSAIATTAGDRTKSSDG